VRYGSQRFLIFAKQVIMFLVRILLLTWIIIAYFMIRSMEFKNQAERNKQELTMDMIRFCIALAACVIVPILISLLSDRCLVRKK